MNIYFLCNIGSRDLMVLTPEGKTEELRPARPRGKDILEHYADYTGRLVLPIIKPTIDHIIALNNLSRGSGLPPTIQVYLLGTDQLDPEHNQTDTLFFAQVASRMIKDAYDNRVEVHDELLIDDINPAMYDEAYERIGSLLRSIHPVTNEPVYILLAGGIPACNTALLLQAVRCFGRNVEALYKPPDKDPQFMRVGRQILEAFSEAAVIDRLQDLDFANALPDLEHLNSARDLAGLARYASQRLAFDFSSAQLTLEQTLSEATLSTRQFINRYIRHSLDDLLVASTGHKRLLALLKELYWNACIVYQHHQYADFLGRVYRFQEAILRYLVESVYKVSTDLGRTLREENQRAWEEMLKANPALVAFGDKIQIDGKKLDLRIIGRPSYQAMLKFATADPPGIDRSGKPLLRSEERGNFRSVVNRVNKLDELVMLRHRTIIGHDFVGVSEAVLIEKTPGNVHPTEILTEIMSTLCKDESIRVSDYQRISDYIVKELSRRDL